MTQLNSSSADSFAGQDLHHHGRFIWHGGRYSTACLVRPVPTLF